METTALVVTIGIIGLGIYDLVVVVLSKGVGTSVSRFLQRTAFKSPVVAFTFGFVCGHIFGYLAPECPSESIKTTQETVQEIDRDCLGPVCR